MNKLKGSLSSYIIKEAKYVMPPWNAQETLPIPTVSRCFFVTGGTRRRRRKCGRKSSTPPFAKHFILACCCLGSLRFTANLHATRCCLLLLLGLSVSAFVSEYAMLYVFCLYFGVLAALR